MPVRQLRDDEPIPDAEAKRYISQHGYVRLRWTLGHDEYVEIYEHRLNAGRPPQSMEVHHLNGEKTDNRPSNLIVLSKRDHAKLHAYLKSPAWRVEKAGREEYHSRVGYEKAMRRKEREALRHAKYMRMRRLYEKGLSTTEIGELFHMDASNVSIHLRQVGTKMRPFNSRKAKNATQSNP